MSPFNRSLKKLKRSNPYLYLSIMFIFFIGVYFFYPKNVPVHEETFIGKSIKCVDGDTFWIDNVKIRLVAIDAPELGKDNGVSYDAKDFTCDVLRGADKITYTFDKGNEEDKYGRKLYWVYVDGQLLQELLLKNGLAQIRYVDEKTIKEDVYLKLKIAQENAQASSLGIWE